MKTIEELTQDLLQITDEYTQFYLQSRKTNRINKELWGALHLGYVAALKTVGYETETLDKVIEGTIKDLTERHESNTN